MLIYQIVIIFGSAESLEVVTTGQDRLKI